MKRTFLVTLSNTEEVSILDWRRYIKTAVECWRRGFHPDEPENLPRSLNVKVKHHPMPACETHGAVGCEQRGCSTP